MGYAMRIAVSGTHCSGKTTLVEDFLATHTDYVHEPEPYECLIELGESATEDLTVSDFYRQLEWSVERLENYRQGARMIAERSPADFVAYMYALRDLGHARNDSATIESALEIATVGMARIDLLVLLPLNDRDGLLAPESEDLELREAMNDRLLELIADASSGLLGSHTRVIEVYGTRRQRLDALERALAPRAPYHQA